MQGALTIRTVRPTWSREMDVKIWMKGKDYSVILITAPAREKGVAFLRRKKEVWNWIPTLERSVRLPPSMMTQSWMGTDFTNDDLVKESSIIEDYNHHLLRDTIINGQTCYCIELIPKPDAAVVWGRLMMLVDQVNFLEVQVRFYDEDDLLVSVMNAYDVTRMGGRLIPARVEMIPTTKKNQRTEIIYHWLRFNDPIDEAFFTLDRLRNLN